MVISTFWMAMIAIGCIALVFLLVIRGYKDGFVLKIIELISTFLSIPIAWIISGFLAKGIVLVSDVVQTDTNLDSTLNHSVNRIVLFVIVFLACRFIIFLCRPIFRKINWVPLLGFLNKFVGAILGFVQAFLVLAVISFLFSTPIFKNGNEVLETTKLQHVKQFTVSLINAPEEMNFLETIQKYSDQTQTLEEKDYQAVMVWMQKHDFTPEQQQEIMEAMKQRS